MRTRNEIEEVFKYHSPADSERPQATAQFYEDTRAAGKKLALHIFERAPESPERTLALRKVQEAVMYANAATAIHGVPAPGM